MILTAALAVWQAGLVDPRLAKPIGIAEYSVTAPQVCINLGKRTGVSISCDPALEDDLVVLVANNRTAKEVMDKVAAVFGWKWQRQRDGYRLSPTDAFTRTAKFGRHEILLQDAKRRREAARTFLRRYPDKAAAEAKFNQLETEMSKQHGFASSDIRESWNEEDRLRGAAGRVAIEQVAAMPLEELAAAADRRIVFSADPGPLEQPLDRTAARIDPLVPTSYTIAWPFGSLDSNDPEIQSARQTSAVVELDSMDSARVALLSQDGLVLSRSTVTLPTLPVRFPDLAPDVDREVRSWPTLASTKSNSDDTSSRRRVSYSRYIARVALALGLDVVSDDYEKYETALREPNPDTTWLTNIRAAGFRPVSRDGWLVNRSERWPLLREETVPPALSSEFELAKHQGSLDEQAAAAIKFSLPQIRSWPVSGPSEDEYWFYQFWEGLPSSQREALLAGKHLRLGDLPESAIEYLYRIGESLHHLGAPYHLHMMDSFGDESVFDEPEFATPGPEVGPLAHEPKFGSAMGYRDLRRLDDFADVYPSCSNPDLPVWLQAVDVPGIEMKGQIESPAEVVVWFGLIYSPEMNLRLARIHAYRLHIWLGGDLEAFQDLSATNIGVPIPGDPKKWPPELLDRILRQVPTFLDPPPPPQSPPPR